MSVEIASPSKKVSLQCDLCDFRTDDEPAYVIVTGDEPWMANYSLMEGELPWPGEDLSVVTTSNSSQANGDTPFSSLDISMVGDRVDNDGFECNYGEATLEEVTGDEVKKDIGPGDVTEHSQAESSLRFKPLVSYKIETAPEEDETSTVGTSVDVTNRNESITCNKEHISAQGPCCSALG